MARMVNNVISGKISSNENNTSAVRRGFGRMFRVVEQIRQGMIDALTGVTSRRVSVAGNGVQPLEARQLFAVTLSPNQFTIIEGATANGVAAGVILLDATTTAGVTAAVTTANGAAAPDTVSTIVFNLNNAAAGSTTVINLASSVNIGGLVSFTNYQPGAIITLNLEIDQINDTSGAGLGDPTTNNGGFQAANYVADSNNGSTTPDTDTDNNTNFTPAGAAAFAGVTFATAVSAAGANSGSTLNIRNFAAAAGNIGTVTLPAATLGANTTTLNLRGLANVSVGNLIVDGAANFAVTTENNNSLGSVTFGTVSLTGASTGSVTLATNGTGNIGAVTFGAVSSTTTATGGITVGGVNLTSFTAGQVSIAGGASSTIAVNSTGTVGPVTFTGLSAAQTAALTVNVAGGTTLGAVNLGVVSFGGTGSSSVNLNNTGSLASLTATSFAVANTASGLVRVQGNVTSVGSVAIAGGLNFSTTNNAGLLINPTGSVGAVTLGPITVQGTGVQNYGAVQVQPAGTGPIGAITLGAITLGDAGEADAVTLNFLASGAAQAVGAISTGAITALGTSTHTLTVNSSTTGVIGNVALGNIVVGEGTTFTAAVGDADATGTPTLTLGSATVGGNGNNGTLNLTLNAAATGATTITGLWNVTGTANLTVIANTTTAGALVGTAWNVDVQQNSAVTTTYNAVDGVGQITINSVDLISDATGSNRGQFIFNSAADTNNNGTGAFTGLTVSAAGDDFSGEVPNSNDAFGFQRTISGATITGVSAGNFSIAGGVGDNTIQGTTFSVNVTGFGSTDSAIGSVSLGAGNTRNSNSDGVVLTANAGIGNITVLGSDSTLTALSVNANADQNAAGALGTVSVTGSGGAASLTGNGLTASSFAPITLTNGNLNLSNVIVDTTAAAQTLRNTTTNAISTITVTQGTLSITTLTSDDGIGAISVDPVRATAATANFGTITTDNDATAGVANVASLGGGLTSLTAGGAINITTLDSDQLNTTNVVAGNAVGNITSAFGTITVGTLDVGASIGTVASAGSISLTTVRVNGNIPLVTVVGGVANTVESVFIDSLTVGGNVGTISSGLANAGTDDFVSINNGVITGSLDVVTAGFGTLSISLQVMSDTVANGALYRLTGTNIDFLVDVRSGTGAIFDTTVAIVSNNNTASSASVNDIEGTTTFANTRLSFATRLSTVGGVAKDYTSGLGTDDSAALLSLGSLQDDFGGIQTGRHDFLSILVEGNLNGDIGGLFDDALLGAGAANIRASVSPNAAVLGQIGSLIVNGNFNNNGAGAGGSEIYALRLDSFAFGTSNQTVTQDINVNNNNTREDIEVFNALTPITQSDVALTTTDGGSITSLFVGPTGAFETLILSDNSGDGVINTAVFQYTAGLITQINLFGQNIGLEYNAVNAANPATTSATNIIYGQAVSTFAPTNVSGGASLNVIDFLEFSSSIGNVTILDVDLPGTALVNESTDAVSPGLGDLFVGYTVNSGNGNDFTGNIGNYVGDNGDGNNTLTLRFTTTAATGTVVRGTVGAINTQGPINSIVTSGNIASVTTTDTSIAARAALGLNVGARTGIQVATAGLVQGLVTDGTVGPISINGTVGSLVAGDFTVINRGADNILGNADDTVGYTGAVGTEFFTGPITVTGGNLGTTNGNVTGNQVPAIGGSQVGAPYGISSVILVQPLSNLGTVDVQNAATLQGRLLAAIVSGKQTQNPATGTTLATVNEETDSLTGSITAVDIVGDIWSGKSISAPITATGLFGFASAAAQADLATNRAAFNARGIISSEGGNGTLNIFATGGSPGDITGNITAAGSITNATIQAGTGTGGGIFANIVAGSDGTGGISGTSLIADDSIGTDNTHRIVSADSATFNNILVGQQTAVDLVDSPTNLVDGGSLNADIAAGVVLGTLLPVAANFNDATLPLFGVSSQATTSNANLTITTLTVGVAGDAFVLGSNINGSLVAGRSVTVTTLTVDGNAVGNDGVVGGHLIAAGLGFSAGNTSTLTVGAGSTVVGNLGGTLSSGTFYDNAAGTNLAASPFNANDLVIVPGTVLTLGDVTVNGLSVGTWDLAATGPTLAGILAGTASTTTSSIVPAFAVGATGNVSNLSVTALGLPFSAPQTGPGSVTADPATGNVAGVGIAAFGSIAGTVTARNSANLSFILSNLDAITAFQVTATGNPSAPATNTLLNNGNAANNGLNVTTNGNGTGGLTVAYDLAGFDPFAVRAGTSFFNGFGLGALTGNLNSFDAHPANGYSVGVLNIGLFAAGGNVSGTLLADGSIVGLTQATDTFSTGFGDADVLAGLSALATASGLNPTNNATFFPGGNVSSTISAGNDLGSAAKPFTVAAFAGSGGSVVGSANNGNLSGSFLSGTRDQFGAGADQNTDINAVLIAAGNFTGTVDAGDFGNVSGNGSGLVGGAFTGGIHAGAGNDLDINAAGDNVQSGTNSGTIRTAGNLDVTGLGILSETAISGSINVGYGPNGGNLLGNIIAENDINQIAVFGNVGTTDVPSLIYTGGAISRLYVGNAVFAASGTFTGTRQRPTSAYIGGFGTLNAEVFQGGFAGGTSTAIYVGGAIGTTSNLVLGGQDGLTSVDLSLNGNRQQITTSGRGLFTVSGADIAAANAANTPTAPAIGVVDVVLRVANANLIATQTGTGPLGLRDVLAGDTLGAVTINDGSVRSINVDDDVNAQAILDGFIADLGTDPSSFSFLDNSLPLVGAIVSAFNDQASLAGINGPISVDFNIGTTSTASTVAGEARSIGAGLNDGLTNWAIRSQGAIGGGITSSTGSVGNILAGTTYSGSVLAYVDIGTVYATTGSIVNESFTAQTGSIGVISAQVDIDSLNITARAGSLGGLYARTGGLTDMTVFVHNDIGLLAASDSIDDITLTAETGDIGFDLDGADFFSSVDFTGAVTSAINGSTPVGIYSDAGNISVISFTAGDAIASLQARVGSILGNITDVDTSDTNLVLRYSRSGIQSPVFTGNDQGNGLNSANGTADVRVNVTGPGTRSVFASAVNSQLVAGGNIGSLLALSDVSNLLVRAGGNVGNITSLAGRVGGAPNFRMTVTEYISSVTSSGSTSASLSRLPDVGLSVEQGVLTVIARGSVGNIDALLDVGSKPVVTALVGGDFTINGGVSITSNASQEIDPVTLEYTLVPVDPTLSTGIGNVFSRTGDINADLLTSGNIGYAGNGTNAPAGAIIGGVAAPLGTVTGSIKAGGSIGGINGGNNPVVPGTTTTTVAAGNPFVITAGGVTYVVELTAATGTVTYTLADDAVTFDSIQLTTTGTGAGVRVYTTTGTRSQVLAGASTTLSNATTSVGTLTVAGNLSNILIEGDLGTATINGNLVGGTVTVTGDVGSINATGNIGSAASTTNPFSAADQAFQFGSGKVGSLTAGGTNFGLTAPITISNGQYLSFANTATAGIASNFITAYIRRGTAVLTINNGFIQNINLPQGSATGLVVFASGTTFDTATDLTPTSPRTSVDNDRVLAAYSGSGSLPRDTTRPSFKGDNGSNVANVGSITSNGISRVSVSNLIVEGDVGSLSLNRAALNEGSTGFSANLSRVTVYGALGEAAVAGTLSDAQVFGGVGNLTTGSIRNLLVTGDATTVAAARTIDGVRISGNVGSLSSGGALNSVRVEGSAIQLSARTASGVVVTGSVGVQVAGSTTEQSLGSVFSKSTIAAVLGLNSANLADGADVGPDGTKFLGGVNISSTVRGLAVGGLISDLFAGRVVNSSAQNLIGQTLDDAYVGVGSNKFFTKTNGLAVANA